VSSDLQLWPSYPKYLNSLLNFAGSRCGGDESRRVRAESTDRAGGPRNGKHMHYKVVIGRTTSVHAKVCPSLLHVGISDYRTSNSFLCQ
jgi:hypothetical protein